MQHFYRCNHCGNLIGLINNAGVPLHCCGEEMQELIPNTMDAAEEKHVPEVSVAGDRVSVKIGSVEHPMLAEHYIEFIYLETAKGGQRKALQPGDKPAAEFLLVDDQPLAVFAYCNLHGVWKKDV